MNLKPSPPFNRDLQRIQEQGLRRRITRKITELEVATTITQVRGVKRLKAAGRHYRIRIGDYRLGITVDGDTCVLARFLHRGEFYRHFP